MGELHELLDRGAIDPDLFSRQKLKLDQEYEKASTFDQTPSRMPSQHGSVQSAEAFADQLQDSILGSDPPTAKLQKQQLEKLDNIDDNIKAAASAEFMFA